MYGNPIYTMPPLNDVTLTYQDALLWLNDTCVISVTRDTNQIRLWNISTGNVLLTLSGHINRITGLQLIDSTTLMSASYDSTIKIWNLASGKLIRTLTSSSAISAIKLMPNSLTLLATGDNANCIKLWDLRTGLNYVTYTGHTWAVSSLEYISSTLLASGGYDNSIIIWNGNTIKYFKKSNTRYRINSSIHLPFKL